MSRISVWLVIGLNGLQAEIEVNRKVYNGLMPRNDHLDDHAIASILTYIRMNFGNKSGAVSALQVSKVRLSSDKE